MAGVMAKHYIVTNTLFLKIYAWFGMIKDGKLCSKPDISIVQLNIPQVMLSGKHAQESCLVQMEGRLPVKNLNMLQSSLLFCKRLLLRL